MAEYRPNYGLTTGTYTSRSRVGIINGTSIVNIVEKLTSHNRKILYQESDIIFSYLACPF